MARPRETLRDNRCAVGSSHCVGGEEVRLGPDAGIAEPHRERGSRQGRLRFQFGAADHARAPTLKRYEHWLTP
jgi:hypothetical protein